MNFGTIVGLHVDGLTRKEEARIGDRRRRRREYRQEKYIGEVTRVMGA